MESMPLISIALCTYNGERYLRAQMDSLLAQAGARIEIIAVDDASQDGTPGLLQGYAQQDPRVRVLANAENIGPSRSFERAMEIGTGEFIAPCDQDDLWTSDKLA